MKNKHLTKKWDEFTAFELSLKDYIDYDNQNREGFFDFLGTLIMAPLMDEVTNIEYR